jgi:two-component sensor histidine kinase
MDLGTGDPLAAPFAVGAGGMAQRVREFDWAATPLGPADVWPPELKTAVAIVLESRFPAAVVWGPDLVTLYNDAFRPILGDKPEALGRSFADVWAEVWDEIGPIAARAFAGEATYIEDFPLQIDRFGRPEQACFTFCYSPIRLNDGTVAGMMDTVVETSASVRARAQLNVLNHELRHRLKNTLASVQAIARQSLKGVADRAAVAALLDRIVAMGRAHDVLFEQGWSAVSLEDVAHATLAPLSGEDRLRLSGPPVRLGARTTIALSLLLHELATNALKYGALSSPEGRLTLTWAVEDKMLRLHWREADGPPVSEPTHRGFGSRLVGMGLSDRSRVARHYFPDGLEVEIDTPVGELARE